MEDTSSPEPLAASPGPDTLEIGVAGALSRQYAGDARAFLVGLAGLLETTLPDDVVVQRRGLLGGDARPVRRIEVTLPVEPGREDARYRIEDAGRGPLAVTRTRIVRGIALKTEAVPIEDWIGAVGAAIVARAENNRAVRDALQDLL